MIRESLWSTTLAAIAYILWLAYISIQRTCHETVENAEPAHKSDTKDMRAENEGLVVSSKLQSRVVAVMQLKIQTITRIATVNAVILNVQLSIICQPKSECT